MKKVLLTLFVFIITIIALRDPIAWQVFYLTADKRLNEELTLPDEYYIQNRSSDGEITFIKRLPNGDNQFIISRSAKHIYSKLLERGVVFSQVEENVYMNMYITKNGDACVYGFFVDDLFLLSVPDSCNCDKEIELSNLISLLRQYYNHENSEL